MSILTGRELEFLGSLESSWTRLYWIEFARLLNQDDAKCSARHEAHSINRISAAPSWLLPRRSGKATKS
jgi:hypothetical protein